MTLVSGAVLVAALVLLPGRAVARCFGVSTDGFADALIGVAIVSIVGLVLGWAQSFSFSILVAILTSIWIGCTVVARRRSGGRERAATVPAVRVVAGSMALAALVWCWPPFETVLAGADSTMYVNAGIHLARTGSLAVESDAVAVLGARTGRGVFPSIRTDGRGPFVRLPGGLLMSSRGDTRALPAFFPLLPVWTGIATLVWGPHGAPVVAPLAVALAVWAVALFAAEAFGAVVGGVAGMLLLANFSFWWFGRFLMPEPLACAFVWGALVLLRRGAYTTAGVVFGLAGLARAETMLFVVAALGLWLVWERPPIRLDRLLLGFVPMVVLTAFSLMALPSHHVAYLWNDIAMLITRIVRGVPLGGASIVVAGLVSVAGVFGVLMALRNGRSNGRVLQVLAVVGVVAATLLYLLVGGNSDPVRSVRWLAAYCSWPLLGMAVAGASVTWRTGRDPVVRLALLLSLLVALIFIINPRVAPYHPWAIRRFLPIVIPGLTIAAASAVGVLASGGLRLRRVAAVLVVLSLVLLEVRPVQAVRHRWYFFDGFRTVETLAEMLPLDAFVIVDSSLADAQVQVPLWLTHGRETVMMASETPNWNAALFAMVASGRPAYWIDARFAPPPAVPGLVFQRAKPDPEIRLLLPNSGLGGPPALTIGRRYMLKVYRVTRAPE